MKRRLLPVVVGSIVLVLALGVSGAAGTGGELDPARNVALPCEVLLSVPQVPRSVRNMTYVANKCGFVGTDIEFQSRPDSTGKIHDYAFVGSMGGARASSTSRIRPIRPPQAGMPIPGGRTTSRYAAT